MIAVGLFIVVAWFIGVVMLAYLLAVLVIVIVRGGRCCATDLGCWFSRVAVVPGCWCCFNRVAAGKAFVADQPSPAGSE